MIIRAACDFDYAHVCRNLRRQNAEEADALREHRDRARLAREFNALAAIAHFRIAYTAGEPAAARRPGFAPQGVAIALLAAYRAADGDAAMHLIATDAWPQIGRAAFRHMRRVVIPRWFPLFGIRHAVTDVRDAGFAARKWLRALGFADDGPPRPLGRDGEMFQRVIWSAPHEVPARTTEGPVDAGADTLVSALPREQPAHV